MEAQNFLSSPAYGDGDGETERHCFDSGGGVAFRGSDGTVQPEDHVRKELNRISTDSTSTYEIVDCSQSPESAEEEMWSNIVRINKATSAAVAELTGSDGSGCGVTADGREDLEYEIRDGEQLDGDDSGTGGGLQQPKRFELSRSSTKEEKQRHNEEIVIMKSNSASSDTTNSWEPVTAEQSVPDALPCKAASSKACFIDASSLFDEDEVVYPSFTDSSLSRTASRADSMPVQLSTILCDDEKIRSGTQSSGDQLEIGDQYSSLSNHESLASKLNVGEREYPENTEEVLARQESERKQGTFIFQNSIQQYSGHLIEPNLQFPEENCSDLSLPSVYSSSSEPNYEYSSLTYENQRYPGGTSTSGYNSGSADYSSRAQVTSDAESSHYPDTPFNSIVNVVPSSGFLQQQRHDDSRASSVDRESHSTPIKIPKRMQKHDESAPIVSGGASIEDFTPKQCESPSVRRRTDTCPIVSGGISFEDDGKMETTRPTKLSSSSGKSWVVDLKNCPDDAKSAAISTIEHNRSGMGFFVDLGSIKTPEEEKFIVKSRQRPVRPELSKKSTGFYIDLSDGESTRSATPKLTGKICTPPSSASLKSESNGGELSESTERKNMFSMFIDFGNDPPASGVGSSVRPTPAPRKMSAPVAVREESAVRPRSFGADESKACFIFIEADQGPIVRRANGSAGTKNESSKRHSWNATGGDGGFHERRIANREYQRSTSVTSDKGIMNILDKIPLLSKTSSMSIDSSVSPFEDFTCSKSEISTYSNHSVSSNSGQSSNESKVSPKDDVIAGEDILVGAEMTASVKKKRKDVRINETFDKSSQGSVTDGVLSSNDDASPVSTTTDTDDVTFQNNPAEEEAVIAVAVAAERKEETTIKLSAITTKQMETIEEAVENSPKHAATRKPPHTMETLHATIEKQKQLLETVSENVESQATSFVKLSDMDKPPVAKFELHSNGSESNHQSGYMSNSTGSNRVARLFESQKYNTIGSAIGASNQQRQQQQQMATQNYYGNGGSIERHSWSMSRSTGNNFLNLVSSVENSRSLSRLFPHLSKVFSTSLPSDVGLNAMNRGHDMNELMQSDFSCTSSITSSRSGVESIDESISSRQPRRLGEDLLKMFLQEIATDVTIEADTKKMRAHKCILRSRCQYFAAILAGGWVQNAGNVISLPGYSYAAVHFALCHIYSGASHPPEGISLIELAALSDLLGLEGLKEVTAYALKTNYCHNFHKPCPGCTDGVLQVLPVTLNHGLDDLYRKCLKWVCKYYVKIWSNKQFSQLPPDVVNRCKQQVVAHMTSENVLNAILDSEQLLTILHPYKWSVDVENVVRDILDAAYDYIADHFASMLASDSFLSLGQNYRWAISHVEPVLLRAATSLSADQACKSYPRATRLHKLLQAKVLTMTTTPLSTSDNMSIVNIYEKQSKREVDYNLEEEMDWCDEFVGMVNAILSAVEQCLIRQCARAMRVSSWQRMDIELRNKIQKLACLMETTDERKSRSRYSYSSQTSSSSSIHSRTNDLRQVRLAIQAHTKRAYESQNNHNVNNKTQQTQTVVHHNDLNNVLSGHSKPTKVHDVLMERNLKQSNHAIENGKISKIASKSHVAEIKPTNKPAAPVKVAVLGKTNIPTVNHRRSQSEDVTGKMPKPEPMNNLRTKLNNVKPRYLEPKKPKNTTNLQTQANNISSSGSSTRTSSPAMGRKKGGSQLSGKHVGQESNISLDSLTSPAKLAKAAKNVRPPIAEMDVSIDSLADSLKSNSIKTSDTLSHESLIYQEYFKPKESNLDRPQHQNQQQLGNTRELREKRFGLVGAGKAPCPNKSTTVAVAKLSTASSRISNTGINRTSSSASVSSNGSSLVKRSFLSQRSREILARRAQEPKSNSTNSSNKSAASSPSLVTRDRSAASDITKSGSSASITAPTSTGNSGTRKIFNTTLHLRRTARLAPSQDDPAGRMLPERKSEPTAKIGTGKVLPKVARQSVPSRPVVVAPNANSSSDTSSGSGSRPVRVESKLERSNTFCKETSDNPVVLQIIE